MIAKNTLAIAGLVALIWVAVQSTGSAVLDGLSVRKPKARIRQWLVDRVLVDLTLTLDNQNQAEASFDGFNGFLVYGQAILSNVTIAERFTIPAQGSVEIPALATIVYTGLASNIVNLIVGGNFLSSLRLTGVLSANGVRFNVTKNLITIG